MNTDKAKERQELAMSLLEASMPHMNPVDPDNRGLTDVWECECCGKRAHLGTFAKVYEYDFCPNCGNQVL